MSRSIVALLAVTLTLAACGQARESRLNPFNWFGGSREVRAEPENANPLIPEVDDRRGLFNSRRARDEEAAYRGQPVDVISELVVERVPGGTLIRATGLSRFQNTYDIRLTPVPDADGTSDRVLEYRLEAVVPARPIPGGPERLREVTAASAVTDNQLEGIRTIRVAGAENARVSARR